MAWLRTPRRSVVGEGLVVRGLTSLRVGSNHAFKVGHFPATTAWHSANALTCCGTSRTLFHRPEPRDAMEGQSGVRRNTVALRTIFTDLYCGRWGENVSSETKGIVRLAPHPSRYRIASFLLDEHRYTEAHFRRPSDRPPQRKHSHTNEREWTLPRLVFFFFCFLAVQRKWESHWPADERLAWK